MKIHCLYDSLEDPKKLIAHDKNRNSHPKDQIERLAKILEYQGWRYPIKISKLSGKITSGHGRVEAAILKGESKVPVVYQEYTDTDQEYADVTADNAIASWSELDLSGINLDMQDLGPEFDIDLLGLRNFKLDASEHDSQSLEERFLVPPFSVLDQKQEYWQNRKKKWISLGIKSEEGRSENLLKYSETIKANSGDSGISIFDPVIAELFYRWYTPKNACIIDPFAGGSVRGIVAAKLNKEYVGIDLREEQIKANKKQAEDICPENPPSYLCGDSEEQLKHLLNLKSMQPFDSAFSCPPYLDLEKYSDQKEDLSNLSDKEFEAKYKSIIQSLHSLLKPNAFVGWVISEVRHKSGPYKGFLKMTIEAFEEAGFKFYQNAVIASPIGHAAMRAARMFTSSRKLCPTHQHLLIFIKGSWKEALQSLEELSDIEDALSEATITDVGENNEDLETIT